jgi:hypothetical protein
VPFFSTKKDRDNEAFARTVVVGALLAQHRDSDALREAQALQGLLTPTLDEETWLAGRIAVSRALARQKTPAKVLADLRAVVAEAKQRSFPMQELSARLALAEAERLQGIESSRKALLAIAEDAKARGYLLLARKASGLLAAE